MPGAQTAQLAQGGGVRQLAFLLGQVNDLVRQARCWGCL